MNSRGFTLQEAYETITKTFGIERTFYFQENAEQLIKGQIPRNLKPVPFKKKFFGIF